MKELTRTAPGNLIFSDILGLVGPKLAAVEAEVVRNLHSEIGIIDELGTYLSSGGGKRVRPLLVSMCGSPRLWSASPGLRMEPPSPPREPASRRAVSSSPSRSP